jgi:hypothetical protein
MVWAEVLEDLEAIAGGMGAVAPPQVKALEAGFQAVTGLVEVMRRLAVLDNGLVIVMVSFKASQGQFMETSSCCLYWEARVGVGVGVVELLLVALVVVARF